MLELQSEIEVHYAPAHLAEDRSDLRRKLADGKLEQIDFAAVVYRRGRNTNHTRFHDHDMTAFASSFAGVPFLRNHGVNDIGNRDGTVIDSALYGDEMRQTIRITTQRGMKDYIEGVIDRFSIGWYFDDVTCSTCGKSWMDCPHHPGRTYDGRLCELVFVNPRGKETSAVNAPAVPGTHILSQLSQLKEQQRMTAPNSSTIYLPNGSTHIVPPPAPPDASNGSTATQQDPLAALGLAPSQMPSEGLSVAQQALDAARSLAANVWADRVDHMIATCGLSTQGQEAVRTSVNAAQRQGTRLQLDDVGKIIAAQRAAEAAAADRYLVQGVRPLHITGQNVQTRKEALQDALSWMFGARGAGIKTPEPGLRDIRDIYQHITGDVNWYGTFNPDYAQLAEATTTTLAGMVVDAINRVTMMHYDNMLTYRWYEQIVDVVPHSGSTHDVNLVTVDGLANLPTVAEGSSYTEAAVGDAKETMAFAKKGAYVGITLEAIRKSDLMRLQAIPRELVKSAIRTRSAAISSIFTQASGTGPTLAQDSTVLFHSNHGNVATTAFSAAGWGSMRTAIYEQTVPGTSKPLGTWPTICLVPVELYDTALTVFGYGAGDIGRPTSAPAQEVNPYAQSRPGDPRPTVIAVPEWTDATDWAAMVDPRLHPVIHMAYANAAQGGSHPLPEIFQVTSESQGLMFSNDTLPVKARDWWAYGVSTYVGIAKRNVA